MKYRQAMKVIYGNRPYHDRGVKFHRESTWQSADKRLHQHMATTCRRWRREDPELAASYAAIRKSSEVAA